MTRRSSYLLAMRRTGEHAVVQADDTAHRSAGDRRCASCGRWFVAAGQGDGGDDDDEVCGRHQQPTAADP